MILYYNNWFDDYTAYSSSASASLPDTNAQNIHLAQKWRTTGDDDQYIAINTVTGVNPTCAFLLATNLTAAATVKIQGHDTNVWTAPDVNITMTRVDENLYYTTTGFSSKQYWRFYLDDAANPDGYIEVSRTWLGDTVTIGNGPSRTFAEKVIDTSTLSYSRSGQVYGDIGYRYKKYSMDFPYWTDAMKTAIDTFVSTVSGGQPFIVAFDENNLDKLPHLYSVLEPNIDYNHMAGLTKWNSNLTFREVM